MGKQRNYTTKTSREIRTRTAGATCLLALGIVLEGLWFLAALAVAGNHEGFLTGAILCWLGMLLSAGVYWRYPQLLILLSGINLMVCIHTFYFDPNTFHHPLELAHRHIVDVVILGAAAAGFPRKIALSNV